MNKDIIKQLEKRYEDKIDSLEKLQKTILKDINKTKPKQGKGILTNMLIEVDSYINIYCTELRYLKELKEKE